MYFNIFNSIKHLKSRLRSAFFMDLGGGYGVMGL